jgi:hypothetical protein
MLCCGLVILDMEDVHVRCGLRHEDARYVDTLFDADSVSNFLEPRHKDGAPLVGSLDEVHAPS